MKTFYTTNKSTIPARTIFLVIVILAGLSQYTSAQVLKAFTQRTSSYTPTKNIYNIKGDFTMIGNTNLTLDPSITDRNSQNGNNNMVYVDVDGDPSTFNSSSANLTFSTENGAIPSCSNIIYAGLYWTGRTDDGTSPNTFSVTKSVPGTVSQSVNSDQTVRNGNAITYSNYSLTIVSSGSNNNKTLTYTFTPSGSIGNTVVFVYAYNNNNPNLTVSVNGGTASSLTTSSIDASTAVLSTPYVIFNESGGIALKVSKFNRNGKNASVDNNAYAVTNVSGLYYPDVNITKNYDKHVISFKGPGETAYTTVTANANDIYYPTSAYGYMYSAYAEVTDYVQQHGLGTYTVADMALKEGDGGGTGLYGGWTMVVVYENSKMKWRDVTIFDGHAYVVGGTASNELPVSGFQTVQNGNVNLKLGIAAGEGDLDISGDYFKIQQLQTASWVTLSDASNSTNNFFNSSINTGGNPRNPNITNNTGVDIHMFNIPNSNNSVITNNQTSTKFQYGSTQDTYIIFCIAMAVDAYIPDVQALNAVVSINGAAPGTTPTVVPGQEVVYKISIYNKGTEGVNNAQVVIPMPYTATSLAGVSNNVYFSPAINSIAFDPTLGATGSLVWNIGNLPKPTDPNTLLAELSYKLTATTDCYILSNTSCAPTITIDGNVTGVGSTSGATLSNGKFIQGYETSGGCIGEPITTPLSIILDRDAYVAAHCQGTSTTKDIAFCNLTDNTIPITAVSGSFPPGSRFYSADQTVEYTISNPFPATVGSIHYKAIPPGTNACIFDFTISVTSVTSVPTTSPVSYCQSDAATPLTATPSTVGYQLYYYTAQTGGTPTTSLTPLTTSPGTTTYYVAEGPSGSCISPNRAPLTVTVYATPTQANAGPDQTNCNNSSFTLAGNTPASGSGSWSVINGTATITTSTSPTSTVTGVPAGSSATLRWTISNNTCTPSTDDVVLTNYASPSCSISADNETVCPASSNTYSAPNGMQTYSWTITGNGTISGATNTQTVTVLAGTNCNVSYTLTLTVTDSHNCQSTCQKSINVIDTTKPDITAAAQSKSVECDGAGNTADFNTWLANHAGATASDLCGGSITWSNDYVAGNWVADCGMSKHVTVIFTATDACNNSNTSSATFTIVDTTKPDITAAAQNKSVECDGAGNTADFNTWLTNHAGATASDLCGGSITWSNDFAPANWVADCGMSKHVTVIFTATDACNNSNTSSATFTIVDTTKPDITAAAQSKSVECDGAGNTADFNTWLANHAGATASDLCGGNITWSNDFATANWVADCGNSKHVTVIFTATDACNNSNTSSATFTIVDTTKPDITAAAQSKSVECDGAGNTADFNTWLANHAGATASDLCGGNITWSNDFATANWVADCGNSKHVTVIFTATDACNNSNTSSATFTIVDTTKPDITAAAQSKSVECDGAGNTADFNTWLAANGKATASDLCGGSITWSNDFATANWVADCGNSKHVTVIFTATDACNNSNTSSATFTIVDTTKPDITAAAQSKSVECDGTGNTADFNTWLAANGKATASDLCGGSITWSNDFAPANWVADCGNSKHVTVIFTATDACNNSNTSSATFTIVDTTKPDITAAAQSKSVECDGAGNTADFNTWLAANGKATASDLCGGSITWSNDFAPANWVADCGMSKHVTVIFTATDACNNSNTSSATFTIVDTTKPDITAAAQSKSVECDGTGNTADFNTWLAANGKTTASDLCGGSITWSNDFAPANWVADCGMSKHVTVIFTATDACNNSNTSSATFTIVDTTKPDITAAAQSKSVECDGTGNTADFNTWLAANGKATASDLCGGSITWSNDFAPANWVADCGNSKHVTVIFTATDACNNSNTSSATFTIVDTTKPDITAAAQSKSVECDGAGNTADFNTWLANHAGATASDLCGGSITWSNDFAPANWVADCGMSKHVTVIFTATDACNNSNTSSATFTIVDTTKPDITAAAQSKSVECDGAGNTADFNTWLAANGKATASDLCGGNITWSNDFAPANWVADCGMSKHVTVIFTATDACNNSNTSSATFTIVDTTKPDITAAAQSKSVECDGAGNTADFNTWLAANGKATASDLCGGSITWSNDFAPANWVADCGMSKHVTVIFTATDACNNSNTSQRYIHHRGYHQTRHHRCCSKQERRM